MEPRAAPPKGTPCALQPAPPGSQGAAGWRVLSWRSAMSNAHVRQCPSGAAASSSQHSTTHCALVLWVHRASKHPRAAVAARAKAQLQPRPWPILWQWFCRLTTVRTAKIPGRVVLRDTAALPRAEVRSSGSGAIAAADLARRAEQPSPGGESGSGMSGLPRQAGHAPCRARHQRSLAPPGLWVGAGNAQLRWALTQCGSRHALRRRA